MASTYRTGLLFVTLSAVAWSTAGFFTRLIPLDSWTMLAWRGVFGAIAIAIAIQFMGRNSVWQGTRSMGWPGWFFAVISAIAMVFFITSLRHTSVAHVAVIYATVPFIAAALAWFTMRETPTWSAVAASFLALAGVAVMMGLGTDGGLLGDGLAFGMTLCMAAMMVISRKYSNIPTMHAASLSALLSGLACWPFGHPFDVTTQQLVLLAAFGLVNSAVGLTLFTLGARLLPAIETALIGSLDAPLAPLWVWLFFNEALGASTLLGGVVVFFAVAFQIAFEAHQRR